jgi:phenylalanyl-tRNA synthetase beta chain
VVDVTNYVMMELGQPLHAFDLDTLDGDIDVRLANEQEQLILLDQKALELDPSMLVIADQKQALALAGIMGGSRSGVSSKTRNVFLESAFCVPEQHAGQARKQGMHTDASHRYERGVDSRLQERALERATALLIDIVGGQAGPITLVDKTKTKLPTVLLRESQIKRILGFAIPAERVMDILTRLALSPETTDAGWKVTVPSHRFDIAIEADFLEELARIYGYEQLPVEPPVAKMGFSERSEASLSNASFRRQLIANGYRETITYSFIDPELHALFNPDTAAVELINPLASDMASMRTSILPGIVSAAKYNLNRQQTRLKLFEMGLGFVPDGTKLDQSPLLAGLLCGQRSPETWLRGRESTGQKSQTADVFDFYDIKADVESLLALGGKTGVQSDVRFVVNDGSSPVTALHPGQSADVYLGQQRLGYVGLLHPQLLKKLDLDQEVWVFELQLNLISAKKVPEFKELSKFPEVRRDLAVIVDGSVSAGDVVSCAQEAATEHLVSLVVFDQYSGAGIEDGKQSIGLGLTWQHSKRTLNEDEVNTLTNDVVASLKQRFNASLR